MSEAIRVGLLGCGTVGTGVLRILAENREEIVARLGTAIEVVKILVRDADKVRDPAVPRSLLTSDPREVLEADVHVIVEVMGGYEPARALLLDALSRGHHVVTANKALLARHGAELFVAADEAHRDVIFEASVGGGIPIIRTLREGLAADRIHALYGIINGTSNFMLTAMSDQGKSYADALADAQARGYAEADPTMDVGGIDAAQKLSILIAISFGLDIAFEDIRTEGIDRVTADDIRFAKRFGYTVKPLAVAKAHADGVEARVHPTLIPASTMLGSVHGVFNAVLVSSRALGPVLFYGQGAGMMPTAHSVVSDIIELGRNIQRGTSGRLPHLAFHRELVAERAQRDPRLTRCPFYLRFEVHDEPGVLAKISGILGDHGISIRQMLQETSQPGEAVPVVILTHVAQEGAVLDAIAAIDALDFVAEPTCYLRVEDLA
ncbi:MAG: homoserine dehydrogenase [Deltaproteobacteria bacterium]|nr:homoserine dehydrogenase [Deltaproteobacteria bacterium]